MLFVYEHEPVFVSIDTAGVAMHSLARRRRQCACHRMLELAIGRLDRRQSAAAILANDTSRAVARQLRAALGGTSYSLPPLGRGTTWRVVAAGPSKNTSCLLAGLDRLAKTAGSSCFSRCPPAPGAAAAACSHRCVAAGLAAAGPAAVQKGWAGQFLSAACAAAAAASDEDVAVVGAEHEGEVSRLTGGTTLELYRLAPISLEVDLVNANSGDVAGDVFFGTMEAQFQCYNRCPPHPPTHPPLPHTCTCAHAHAMLQRTHMSLHRGQCNSLTEITAAAAAAALSCRSGELFSCNNDPMNEGKALRMNTAVCDMHAGTHGYV